jgi:DNA end-binding protein Ku
MKSIWTGAIGFGLVNIPVKLYSATKEHVLDLDMLDKKDHARIRYQRVNENTGKQVRWENIVKGYKVDERYVVLTEEDFEKASPEKTREIAIMDFVRQEEIDAMYYETPYFLEPQKSGERAYLLLRDALKKSGKLGLASFVLRNKEHLCVLKPFETAIMLIRIRYAQEIRSLRELSLPGRGASKPGELKMAMTLIDQLSAPFHIEKYRDSYQDELLKLIRSKAKGKAPAVPKLRVVHNRSKDLMSQLKESLSSKRRKAS